ncbi:MAG: hypothetical protein RBS96_06385 [Dehalococcoidales bacterium]|jgi:hypothetical protein|nr:hypothetical protein [Dehalococcoidales bacterium]
MKIKEAHLIGFDSINYRAEVQLVSSLKAYLSGITVANNISANQMLPGRKLLINFIDGYNPRSAVVIAVFE